MIYLDNSATTFLKPNTVYEAVNKALREFGGNPGRGGHRLSVEAARCVYQVREKAACMFGVSDPMRVIFTSNGTESLNTGIKGVLSDGDHVIVTAYEHNSVYRPLTALRETKNISFDIVEPEAEVNSKSNIVEPDTKGHTRSNVAESGMGGNSSLAHIRKLIRPETKLVVVNHMSNVTGYVAPVEEIGKICREANILFLVDASQSAGILDIDIGRMNIDLLAAAGHKALFGLQGTGILYVGERAEVRPLKEGGTGSYSSQMQQPQLLPDRYESGTLNLPGIAALGAGFDFIQNQTLDEIRAHDFALAGELADELRQLKDLRVFHHGGAVLSVCPDTMDPSEMAYRLDDEYAICTRDGLHCAPCAHKAIGTADTGAVRFSIGYFNTKEEIRQTADAVRRIMNDGIR